MLPTTQEAIAYRPEADTFDVRASIGRLFSAVLSHKLVILTCCMLSLGLVLVYVKLFPPVFMSSVMLSIEGKRPTQEFYYSDWNLFRKQDVSAESEFMVASLPVGQVIEKLNLTYDDVYHRPLNHLRYLWQSSYVGRKYKALKDYVFKREPGQFGPTPEQIERARATSAFQDGASLEWVAGTDVAYLLVRGPSPRVAEYANTLIDSYLAIRRQVLVDEAESVFATLSNEVERTRAELAVLMAEKSRFDTENELVAGAEKDRVNLGIWSEMKLEILDLEVRANSVAAQLAVVEEQLGEEERTLLKSRTLARNGTRAVLEETALEIERDLVQARQIYTDSAPEVRHLQALLAETRASVEAQPRMVDAANTNENNDTYRKLREHAQEMMVTLAATQAELETKREAFEPIIARLAEVPALLAKSAELDSEIEVASDRYAKLAERMTTADVSRVAAKTLPSTIRIVEYATPPLLPNWPKTKLLAIGALLVGFTGGVVLVLLMTEMSGRVTRSGLRQRSDLPVYAVVDVFTPRRRHLALLTGASESSSARALDRLARPKDDDAS